MVVHNAGLSAIAWVLVGGKFAITTHPIRLVLRLITNTTAADYTDNGYFFEEVPTGYGYDPVAAYPYDATSPDINSMVNVGPPFTLTPPDLSPVSWTFTDIPPQAVSGWVGMLCIPSDMDIRLWGLIAPMFSEFKTPVFPNANTRIDVSVEILMDSIAQEAP